MSFKDFAMLFLNIKKNVYKISTYDKVEGIVFNRLSLFFDYKISDLRSSVIQSWIFSINDVGIKSKKHYLNVLSQIFKLALNDGLILKNPCDCIKLVYRKPSIKPFSSFEVSKILEKSLNYSDDFQMFLKIGFFTGLRTGEILALKVFEVDLINKVLHVNSTRSRFGESSPKTFYSIRKVPIFDVLYYDLKNFIKLKKNNIYLFEDNFKKPYRDSSIFSKFYKDILTDLNFEYRRIYTMRHTFATNFLINSNLSPVELSKILGHSSVEMVYKVYVKYLDDLNDNLSRNIKIYDF